MIAGITLFCFGASYVVAWVLDLLQLSWTRVSLRVASLAFCGAGLLAHTLYLAHHFFRAGQPPPLTSQTGSLLFLAWILAVFALSGSLHYRRLSWGVFVLPVVAGLVGLAWVVVEPDRGQDALDFQGEGMWRRIHSGLLVLAAVGISVAFVASTMYLVQARRLKSMHLQGRTGLRLFSLERLEAMNRRAINGSFPLLTAGVLIGAALLIEGRGSLRDWSDPKVLAAGLLWLLFALLLYLRYGAHVQGRRLALLTIVAFGLLVFTLATAHTFVTEVGP